MVYTTKQAETAIIFQICALAEVGNIKNNLIAVSNNIKKIEMLYEVQQLTVW